MQLSRLTLQPLTAFGTPLAGDTLFGQLCWTLRHQHGNQRLVALLDGYTAQQPFAAVSDGLPHGFVPLANVPSSHWHTNESGRKIHDRKILKKKRWLPLEELDSPFATWQGFARSDAEAGIELIGDNNAAQTERAQAHNTIDRLTGTTGEGAFAPYAASQIWFHPAMRFDIYIAFDPQRISSAELDGAFETMGQIGFGRDASIGLGKFKLDGKAKPHAFPKPEKANGWLTLGPCAPQGQGFCPQRSFYQTMTRFGRHGDAAAQSGTPFKRPILLAKAGAVFRPEAMNLDTCVIGQGIGGVSETMPEAVSQGYAPALPICLPE